MVKVLQCHHFIGQKVLSPKTEPITAQIYRNRVFALTKRPGIQIHGLGQENITACYHVDTSHVRQFQYLETQQAIVTLETGSRLSGVHVYVYHIPEELLSYQVESKQVKGPGYHCKTPVTGFANPTCVCADQHSSNIGIGTKDHVYIYNIQKAPESSKPLAPCYDIKCLLEISVSIVVMRISLAEGFVLFASDTQVQVVQLHSTDNQTVSISSAIASQDTNQAIDSNYLSYKSKYLPESLVDDQQNLGRSVSRTSTTSGSSVCSNASQSDVLHKNRGGTEASIITLDKHHVSIAEDDSEEGYGAIPVVWMKSIKQAHVRVTAESLRRDEIILGPVKNHPRCSVFINSIASTKLQGRQDKTILTYLFREVDQSAITHVELRALYKTCAEDSVSSSSTLQSDVAESSLGVLCYVSTYTEGYLYNLHSSGTYLLQTYQYSTQMLHVSLGLHQLFVATDVGIEIYTLDSVASVLLKDSKDKSAEKLCGRSREPCLIGLQPFFSLASISEASKHVVVLSKVEGEDVWGIYALEKPPVAELCQDMVSTAELHRPSSLGTYTYMLQQAYNHLKACVLLEGSTAADEEILSQTAFLLGQVNASPPGDTWQLCVPYFLESGKTFGDILHECLEANSIPPGRGMLNYMDYVLFNKTRARNMSELRLGEKEAHLVLSIFSKWRPQLLSAVVVCSPFTGYDPEFALSRLQTCSKTGLGREFYSNARDGLAAALLHLSLGQVADAEHSLAVLSQPDLVELCVENLYILINKTGDTETLSPLGQLLRKHHPYTMVETFTHCVQKGLVTLATLQSLLSSNTSDVHFNQILESLACDNANESLFCDIANSLKDVYLRHLKSKPQGAYDVSSLKYILPKRDGLFKERYRWLNNVPPLQGSKALRKACQKSGKMAGVTAEDTELICPCTTCNADLLKLQGLACSSRVSEDLLKDILVETLGHSHLLSVQLVCLLRTDSARFAVTMLDSCSHLAAQIVKDLTAEKNFTVMQSILKYIFDKQKEHQLSGDNEGQKSTKLIIKEVMSILSEALSPEQLFHILPPDGNSRFFLRYIVRCLKLHQAQVIQGNVSKEAQTYLSKIMKA